MNERVHYTDVRPGVCSRQKTPQYWVSLTLAPLLWNILSKCFWTYFTYDIDLEKEDFGKTLSVFEQGLFVNVTGIFPSSNSLKFIYVHKGTLSKIENYFWAEQIIKAKEKAEGSSVNKMACYSFLIRCSCKIWITKQHVSL